MILLLIQPRKIVKIILLTFVLLLSLLSGSVLRQTASAATLPAAPTVPKNLKATVNSSSSITLSWSASSTKARIKYYSVYRNGIRITTTTKLNLTDNNLKSLTAYRYTVSATDTNLKSSAQSAAISATTLAAPPTALTGSNISPNQVTVSWKASPDANKLTGYYVYRNGVKVKTVAKTAVTVIDTGLTPNITYSYKVRGYYNSTKLTASTNTLSITTLPSVPTVKTVSSCIDIVETGSYSLVSDIGTTTTVPCIKIHDTSNVIFNCNNHNVVSNHTMAVSVTNVTNFTLTNCNISSQGAVPSTSYVLGAEFINTTGGIVQSNVFSGSMIVVSGFNTQFTVKNNAFINASLEQIEGNHTYIGNNYLSWDGYAGGGLITLTDGSFSTVEYNTVDGFGGGTYGVDQYGFDDGIVISSEDSDIINNNTITKVFDCGIETYGLITNTIFRDNEISHASACGIGGWHYLSWRNNTVSGNKVDDSKMLFWFFREHELREDEQYVYFDNNTFINNTLTNGTSDVSAWFNLTGSAVPTEVVVASNNTFTENNFSTTASAPYLKPETMIIDGGRNICGAYNYDSPAHLVCEQ